MTTPQADAAPPKKGITYVECPHCHHNVQDRPDGKCLACGKNRLDTTGINPDQGMVTIENISTLPACCFMCGTDTQRMQTFTWTYRINPYELPFWMVPLVKLMSFVPGSQYSTTEHLSLPTCPDCGKIAKKSKPLSVWSGLECRLLVHRNFRERFIALNGAEKLEWEGESRVAGTPLKPTPTTGIGINTST